MRDPNQILLPPPDDMLRRELEDSPIGRLCLSLYPCSPGRRPFMILTACYDESGTHAGSPLTVIAGFIGEVEEWASFDREWRKVLRKYDIEFVRAKSLFHRQKQFKGWSEKKTTHLWADMLYVLQEHKKILGSKTVLLNEDYKLFYVSDGPSKRERLDTRYALCFRQLVHFCPHFHRSMHPQGAVNFVLEAGHKNAGDALRVFDEMKADRNFIAREALGFMSFGAKPDVPGLQAADALAYWFYRTEIENLADDDFQWSSHLETELFEMGKTVIGAVITPKNLMTLRTNFLRKKKKPLESYLTLNDAGPMVDPSSSSWA